MTAYKAWLQDMTEAQFRQWLAYQFQQSSTGVAKTGVLSGLGVTATTPSASGSVVVGKGAAVCQPSSQAFPLVEPADETFDVFTANPMQFVNNPRNDVIVLDQVTGLVTNLVGTPNAVPSSGEQSVPATAVPLARLRHAANATTIPASVIDDLKVKVGPFTNDPAWLAVTSFEAGAASDGTSPAQYRVWPNGKVELRGVINASTTFAGSGVKVATLPVGARPSVTRYFSAAHSFATANTSDSRFQVNTDGTIWLYTQASQTTWFALDGQHFYLT